MIDILISILAILFVLGVAINIHEFGHFMIAKLFRMRVEAYSFFGLGPRLFGFKIGNTDYRVSAIPLGAYVKLYGDEATASLEGGSSEKNVDAFLDERNIGNAGPGKGADAHVVPVGELYELRPRWQKFLVMLGGPFMNIMLALAIPFGMAMIYGVPTDPAPIIGYVAPASAAETAGIKMGDRIVNFDGVEDPSWDRVFDDALLMPGKQVPIDVERDGKRLALTIAPAKVMRQGHEIGDLGMDADPGTEPVVVGNIEPDMPAATSGLQKGDWIMSVNDKVIRNADEMKTIVGASKDQPIKLGINRNGQRLEITTQAVETKGEFRIGIGFDRTLLTNLEPVGIGGAMTAAVNENLRILRLTGKALGQVGKGERSARDTLSGPIGIGQVIIQSVFANGFVGLFSVLMMISLSLGVMNLLPIPMLDGGQIMVLGVEKVLSWFGRTLSLVAKERIQLTGLAIVLLLMVTVMYFDISRMVGK